MKKYVFLALLCGGILLAAVAATSVGAPVRSLSQAEKANIIAGECHKCIDCRAAANCNGPAGCTTGATCGVYVINLDLKCVSGTGSQGPCTTGCEDKDCYKVKVCYCNAGVGWSCDPESTWTIMQVCIHWELC